MKQRNLFLAFFRAGMLGYGGGPSSIPLIHKEVVEKYKWMDDREFSDILALGNTLPGPIATKMAGYIGYRVAGVFGMINAVLATIVPTIFLMILLMSYLTSFKDNPYVTGMTRAVVPVIGVMLAVLTWQFFSIAKKDMGWIQAVLLAGASVFLIHFLNVHPGIIIGVLLLAAVSKRDSQTKQRDGGGEG